MFLQSLAASALLTTSLFAQSQVLTTPTNNGMNGDAGTVMYFDVDVQTDISVRALDVHFRGSTTGAQSINVWVRSGSWIGQDDASTGWLLAATGSVTGPGASIFDRVSLSQSIDLDSGRHGVMVEYIGDGVRFGDGSFPVGDVEVASNADLTIFEGGVGDGPFNGLTGAPRAWNGSILYDLGGSVGTNYCGPANANSTGQSGRISADGSGVAASNDLTLLASNLPPTSFGFFIVSAAQGFTPNPGGSQGNLCLAGAIGRYVGAGQIQQSNAAGAFSLMLDLAQTPQPAGFVAITSGQTWNFQAWHRDFAGAPTSNLTDGLSISFL